MAVSGSATCLARPLRSRPSQTSDSDRPIMDLFEMLIKTGSVKTDLPIKPPPGKTMFYSIDLSHLFDVLPFPPESLRGKKCWSRWISCGLSVGLKTESALGDPSNSSVFATEVAGHGLRDTKNVSRA